MGDKIKVNGEVIEYDVSSKDSRWKIIVGENEEVFDIFRRGDEYLIRKQKGDGYLFIKGDVYRGKEYSVIWVGDQEFIIQEVSDEGTQEEEIAENSIKSEMPGVIKEIKCKEGQEVKKGDVLVVYESMKVMNELKAMVDGIVKKIHVNEGEQVGPQQLLVEIEEKEEDK